MANPTAELMVKIGSDTKQLKTGLDSANKQTAGFTKNIQKHSKAIGIAMIAVGVAIVAVAAKSVISYAKMGDEVAKMAKRTGFSAESLSELRHAAEISGAELSSLEKGVKRMAKTIVDASEGMATYIRAFDRIGVSVEDLMGLQPEEQFNKIAMAIAGLEDPTLRAATAQDIFGRAGTQLLPLFDAGTEGIARLCQEAHDLGIVFDAEAAVKAEELTDAMTNLKSSIKGAEFAIAEALIPAIKPLIDKITEVTKGIASWVGENEALAQVVAVGGILMMGLGTLLLILPKLKGAILAIKASLSLLMLEITALTAGLALLGFGIYSLIKSHADWDKVVEAAVKVNEELEKSEGKVTEAVIEATRTYNELRVAYGQLGEEEAKEIAHNQEIIDLFDQGTYVINAQTGALEVYTETVRETGQEVERLTRLEEIRLEQAKKMLSVMAQLFPGGFTEEQWEAWKEAGLLTQQAITGLQKGGIVTKPTVAMVGEKGPEAVIPLDKGMGNITINFTEPVFMEREESINKLADKVYRVIKKDQRLSFGGAYSG